MKTAIEPKLFALLLVDLSSVLNVIYLLGVYLSIWLWLIHPTVPRVVFKAGVFEITDRKNDPCYHLQRNSDSVV